jgi:glycosyltransferase involved in cell wall biosynthesis
MPASRRFGFVLEQTLGHRVLAENLLASLRQATEIDSTVIRVNRTDKAGPLRRHIPGAHNWSLEASVMARRALNWHLRRTPMDALFFHTQVTALLSVSLMRRIPSVISLDATPRNFDRVAPGYRHREQGRRVEQLKAAINRRAFLSARLLTPFSRWAADSLVDDYAVPSERITVIPPGVDLEIFKPAERHQAGDRLRLLFVGADFERKGGTDLLAAVARLGDRVELDVVTEPGESWVGAGSRVHTGIRPRSPELVALYQRADVFVLPSRAECSPNVIAEALACGLAVVACRTGAIPEMVRHGVNGFLVPPADITRLAEALRILAGAPDLRADMGRRSLELARREHDAARNHRQLFELMSELSPARATAVATPA